MNAARDAFIDGGYTGTTIERIVGAANTSRATFYLHFKNKTEALLATWRELDLPEVEEMFISYDDAGDFSARAATAWIERVVSYWEDHGRIGRTALQALALEPDLEQVWIAGIAQTGTDMPHFREALGGGPEAEAIVLANTIQIERVLYFWSNDGLPVQREALIAALARNWTLR
jgi:AcrR family transcriptional regulator